tara:strand:- start:4376 stop:5218 length:843 start_codon:yes stop_codon:yes gene_type:complete
MLKKIFKAAKKAAPIIGAGLGFLAGSPVLGSAIGGGLGSLVAGRNPRDALKFAALSGLTGGALNKFGGLQAGQGLGGLFTRATSTPVPPNILQAVRSNNPVVLKDAIMKGAVEKPGVLQSIVNFAKANPIKTALGLSALTGVAGGLGEEENKAKSTFEDVYGTMNPLKDLDDAGIGGVTTVPFSQYGPNLVNRAMGGEINGLKKIGLNEGGFPRKNGKIAGPGTETSDDIPAMLSDGEFVINAKTVRGLGRAMGGEGTKESRDRGSKFLYSLQRKYGDRT